MSAFKAQLIWLVISTCIVFTVFSKISYPSANYIGGRYYTNNHTIYKTGRCQNISGALSCPIGYTSCIEGFCYYVPSYNVTYIRLNSTSG